MTKPTLTDRGLAPNFWETSPLRMGAIADFFSFNSLRCRQGTRLASTGNSNVSLLSRSLSSRSSIPLSHLQFSEAPICLDLRLITKLLHSLCPSSSFFLPEIQPFLLLSNPTITIVSSLDSLH